MTGFRKTIAESVNLVPNPTPLAAVTPAAGAYLGGATTTITAGPVSATVACTLTEGTETLGTANVVVDDVNVPTARVSIQLGLFTATGAALEFQCTSEPPVASASNTVLAGLSVDAIPASP